MKFESVEDAYKALANYLLAFIDNREWDSSGCALSVLGSMANGNQWLIFDGNREERGGFECNPGAIWDGLDAAIFLRDNLLRTSGQRIWGLTFTLYPNGKFNIEYDYNKPEDYEETDEVITGDEINQSLSDLGGNPSS